MLELILLLCLGVVKGSIVPHDELQNIDTNVDVFTETWKFVTSIDISYYQDELEHVRGLVRNTSNMCTGLNGNISENVKKMLKVTRDCKATVRLIDNILDGMEFDSMRVEKDEVIRDDFLEQLAADNQINALSNYFINNSVTLIKQSTDLIKKNSSKDLREQSEHHKTQIKDILDEVNRETKNYDSKASRIKNYLQDIFLYTSLVLTRFKDKHVSVSQTMQMKSVTNEMLLPSTILVNNLKELRQVIKSRRKTLSFNIEHEGLSKFYDIARIEKWIFENKLIIVYILPLVDLHSEREKDECDCENIKIWIHVTIAIVAFFFVCIIILMLRECCPPSIRERQTQTSELEWVTSKT